ncbi:unnamed protein product [Amaranthus hypochondriacus]
MASTSRFFIASIVIVVAAFLCSAVAEPELVGNDISGPDFTPQDDIKVEEVLPEREDSKIKRIQGMIFCKSNGKLTGLEGATVKVACTTPGITNEKLPVFSVESGPTDKKGYYMFDLQRNIPPRYNIKDDCKVYIGSAGTKNNDCDSPTNDSQGLEGASLNTPSRDLDPNTSLFSVGGFTFEPKRD